MLKVSRETVYSVEMDASWTGKLERALGRMLNAVDELPAERRSWLVNTHTVDTLLALKTALVNEMGRTDVPEGDA